MITCNVKYTITLDMYEFNNLVSSIEDVLNTFTLDEPYIWDQDPIADSSYRKQIDLLDKFKNDLLNVAVYKLDLGEE